MDNLTLIYMLEFCDYDKEPLHIVIDALLDDKLIEKAEDIIPLILDSFNRHYINCWWDTGKADDPYIRLNEIKKDDLENYVRNNKRYSFKRYPSFSDGGEYYIRTTDIGIKLVPDDYEHPG